MRKWIGLTAFALAVLLSLPVQAKPRQADVVPTSDRAEMVLGPSFDDPQPPAKADPYLDVQAKPRPVSALLDSVAPRGCDLWVLVVGVLPLVVLHCPGGAQ